MLITISWTVRQQVLCHCIEENFETFPGSDKLSNDETRIFSNLEHKEKCCLNTGVAQLLTRVKPWNRKNQNYTFVLRAMCPLIELVHFRTPLRTSTETPTISIQCLSKQVRTNHPRNDNLWWWDMSLWSAVVKCEKFILC